MSLPPCRRYHPAGVNNRISQFPAIHPAFALRLRARPPGICTFEATCAFTFVTARQLACIPKGLLCQWASDIRFPSSLPFKLWGFWPFTPAGLTPAEHASLLWTHNRTFSFLPPWRDFPIIFTSSRGQLNGMTDGGAPAYQMSKAALNTVTLMVADAVRGENVLVNSVCPGWTRTNLGGPEAPRSVEEAAETIL